MIFLHKKSNVLRNTSVTEIHQTENKRSGEHVSKNTIEQESDSDTLFFNYLLVYISSEQDR